MEMLRSLTAELRRLATELDDIADGYPDLRDFMSEEEAVKKTNAAELAIAERVVKTGELLKKDAS